MSATPSVLDGIFRTHYDWLCRWARNRTPDGHLPEDIAAETMLRITRVAAQEVIHEPRAMLTVIARRIMYDLRARGDLQRAYESAVRHLPAMLEPSAEERLLAMETLARIECALQPLSVKARSAFLLSQIDGMRHAQIAEILGVSVSMVRKYIGTAMRCCYEIMHDDD